MKGQLFFHLSNWSNLQRLLSENICYFFFIFPLLSFLHDLKNREMIGKYFTIFKHAQKWNKEQSFFHLLNWNNLEKLKIEKYFIISRKKWNKRQSFFHFSKWNNFRFGDWTKMVEKYFIIFRQKWNKRQSFFHLSNVLNWSNLESYPKIFAILFLFFLSSPFYTLNRIENDRKVLDNFQTCAEMKHRTIQVLRKRKTVIRITHTLFRAREII